MIRRLLAAAAVAGLALLAPAVSSAAETRYSLANGCYAIAAAGGGGGTLPGAEQVRMRPTTLGRYLLYRPDGTFLSAQGSGGMAPASQPGPAADWQVQEADGDAFTLAAGEARLTVRFTPAEGCAQFPEAELGASGTPARGEVPYGQVAGLVEGHMHWMTYEYLGGRFHCGRPWHPYGIPFALPDCADIEGPSGTAAPVQNFLNYGLPEAPHDTTGWPKLTSWGRDNLTYEGTYWRWIERAWLGGLRLMVMGVNENRFLCNLQANRVTNCNEMDTVRRGMRAIRELQRYVDAQAGGPGKGFFQIVTDPYEARRVINEGRMAVVLEVEISEPFDCRGWETSTCDTAQVDRQLAELHDLGVRSMLLLNKVDNPLTGVRFDGGPIGMLINVANRLSSGSFWSARTCTGKLRDNEIFGPPGGAELDFALGSLGIQSGSLPTYPPPPHCNTRGLTALGRHVVGQMIDRGMIVNPDHMSQAAVDDTLTLLESRRYSGVISPHGWMDPGNWPRLWKLGGVAFPGHSEAGAYTKEWQRYRPRSTPYFFGWGYGADLGGLSGQPSPSGGGSVAYPFKSYDGRVTFERQRTGERTFDYVREGVAHYGLYAEWFADLRRLGGDALARDMDNGAEAYLQMWERAGGVVSPRCASPRSAVGRRGRGSIRLGSDWQTLLRRAGQPQQRSRAWSWCVAGKGNARAADVAVLDDGGRVRLVGSTARGRSAGGVPVGSRASRLPASARRVRGVAGVRVRRLGSASWVYVLRGGRVRAVATASRSLVRAPVALRRAARLLRPPAQAARRACTHPARPRPLRAGRSPAARSPARPTRASTARWRCSAACRSLRSSGSGGLAG